MKNNQTYAIQYDPKAVKELSRLDTAVAQRIVRAVNKLQTQPRPVDSRPLVGFPGLWRLRVADYRVIYTIRDTEVTVILLRIAHRREVYNRL